MVVTLAIDSLGVGCVGLDAPQRTILYDERIPIAERLSPNDKQVVVIQRLTPGLVVDPTTYESFDDEISRLRDVDVIALVRIVKAEGELTDDGTWIRTRVTADVEHVVRSRSKTPFRNQIEFSFPGGTAKIRDTFVTAGIFPRYTPSNRYLVFLSTNPSTFPELAFRIDAKGVVRPIVNSDGNEQVFKTNLIGLHYSSLSNALMDK